MTYRFTRTIATQPPNGPMIKSILHERRLLAASYAAVSVAAVLDFLSRETSALPESALTAAKVSRLALCVLAATAALWTVRTLKSRHRTFSAPGTREAFTKSLENENEFTRQLRGARMSRFGAILALGSVLASFAIPESPMTSASLLSVAAGVAAAGAALNIASYAMRSADLRRHAASNGENADHTRT